MYASASLVQKGKEGKGSKTSASERGGWAGITTLTSRKPRRERNGMYCAQAAR